MKADIIFDFDGVIHDTFQFHLERVRNYFGVELSESEFRDMHNGNFYRSIPEQLKEADWISYREHVAQEFEALRIENGIAEILRVLSESARLHVVSAGGTRIIEGYLRNNGVRDLFSEVLGGDIHYSKSRRIVGIREQYRDPQHAYGLFFVTDTLGDILEGKEAGAIVVATDAGYHDRETLLLGEPHRLISDLRELPSLLHDIRSIVTGRT